MKRRITGFCNPDMPRESHARCDGAYVRGPAFEPTACECDCHSPDSCPAPSNTGAPVSDRPADEVMRGGTNRGPGGEPSSEGAGEAPRLGVYDALDEADYHADPTSVSASGMKNLLRSPAHFQHYRKHPKVSDAMDLGTIAHTLILGTGQEYVAVEGNRNRNDVKAAIAEAEAAGKLVLKPEQLAAAERMADAVLSHPKAARILTSPGRSEVSMFYRDPVFDVIRRCRWDRLGDDGIGVDLKTGRTADPLAVPKAIVEWGYDLSAAWYLDVSAGVGVDVAAFALVFVENTEPHPVVVIEPNDEFLERGAALATKALTVYRNCLDTGRWPGYCDDDYVTVSPPAWADTAEQIRSTTPERTNVA